MELVFQPENWNANAQVFDEYLRHYPVDYTAPSKYAFLDSMSGQIETTHRLFQRVGDHPTPWPEDSSPRTESLRKARDETAKMAETLKRQSTSPK